MSKRSRKVAFEEEVVEYADKRRRNEEERWQEGERSKWALFVRASFPASLKSGRVSGASRVSRPFCGGGESFLQSG